MRRPLLTLIVAAILSPPILGQDVGEPVAYSKFKHGGYYYHMVKVDLSRTSVTPTAYYSPRLRSIWHGISDRQPIAAITGTFFAFENQQPVADVVIDGQQVATGYRGSVLAVDWYGNPSIFDASVGKELSYDKYRYVLRGMVRIVENGQVNPAPWTQGFTDSGIWGRARRTAIGLTENNKLIMLATSQSISLRSLGKAMLSRGATQAVSLDGGGSASLYYMGDMKLSPHRGLSTLFMIEKRSPYDDLFHAYLRDLGKEHSANALAGVLGTSKSSKKD